MYNVNMIENGYIDFEWDERKAAINAEKHGVSFEAAADAFSGPIRPRRAGQQALGPRGEVLPDRDGLGIAGADGLSLREARRLDHQDNLGEEIDENRGAAVLEVSK